MVLRYRLNKRPVDGTHRRWRAQPAITLGTIVTECEGGASEDRQADSRLSPRSTIKRSRPTARGPTVGDSPTACATACRRGRGHVHRPRPERRVGEGLRPRKGQGADTGTGETIATSASLVAEEIKALLSAVGSWKAKARARIAIASGKPGIRGLEFGTDALQSGRRGSIQALQPRCAPPMLA